MNPQFGIAFIKVKTFLSNVKKALKPNIRKKRKDLKSNTEKYRKEIVFQLFETGYRDIKDYSLSTWKFYGIDHVRLTFKAKKDNFTYIIKVTKGFEEKVNNSIKLQNKFNDVFSFIPKGFEIHLDGYVGYATEYIPSYPFLWSKYFIDKKIVDSYLTQINYILDELYKYRIVHCDLEEVNVLVSKKDKKLYIIDWDTCCSDIIGLDCEHFPGYTIKRKTNDNKYIYDDAYSFCTLLKRLNIDDLEEKEGFIKIKKRSVEIFTLQTNKEE